MLSDAGHTCGARLDAHFRTHQSRGRTHSVPTGAVAGLRCSPLLCSALLCSALLGSWPALPLLRLCALLCLTAHIYIYLFATTHTPHHTKRTAPSVRHRHSERDVRRHSKLLRSARVCDGPAHGGGRCGPPKGTQNQGLWVGVRLRSHIPPAFMSSFHAHSFCRFICWCGAQRHACAFAPCDSAVHRTPFQIRVHNHQSDRL